MKRNYLKKLICPKCSRFWAELDIRDYPVFEAKHVKILYGNKRKLKNGDSLRCADCSHEYTTWDITIAAAEPNSYEGLKPGEKMIKEEATVTEQGEPETNG
jgi:hypothetical protein